MTFRHHIAALLALPLFLTAPAGACPQTPSKGEGGLIWAHTRTKDKQGRDACIPKITKFSEKTVLAAVNSGLAARVAAVTCAVTAKKASLQIAPSTTYARAGFFSVTFRIDDACIPETPYVYETSETYDLKTGKLVKTADAFRGPELYAAAVAANPKQPFPKGCPASGLGLEAIEYALTPSGVDFWAVFDREHAACSTPLRLRWKEIEPHLADGGPLGRLIKKP